MSFRDVARYIGYVVNPAGALIDYFQGVPNLETGQYDQSGWSKTKNSISNWWSGVKSNVSDWWNNTAKPGITNIWDDLTGKSQIKMQNELDKEMADYKYQKDLEAIQDTLDAEMAAYDSNGLNRNLIYSSGGSSPINYEAPNLQAYSGSSRLDTILSRVGKVLSFLPAMYNATASLERIDQEREKTKQSEIRTMSDGINLLRNGFSLSDTALTRPYGFDLTGLEGGKRHIFKDLYNGSLFRPHEIGLSEDPNVSRRYMDAVLKNQFDLLESIGISNDLRRTRNDYLGYQYGLDKRFGAAGRIVGMASQGLGAASKFLSPQALKFWKLK